MTVHKSHSVPDTNTREIVRVLSCPVTAEEEGWLRAAARPGEGVAATIRRCLLEARIPRTVDVQIRTRLLPTWSSIGVFSPDQADSRARTVRAMSPGTEVRLVPVPHTDPPPIVEQPDAEAQVRAWTTRAARHRRRLVDDLETHAPTGG